MPSSGTKVVTTNNSKNSSKATTDEEDSATRTLDLSSCPPFFILSTHLDTDELHEIEDTVYNAEGQLTYQANEGKLFLGKVTRKRRAAFDLRVLGIWTEEADLGESDTGRTVRNSGIEHAKVSDNARGNKRRKLDDPLASSSKHRRRSSSTVSAEGDVEKDDTGDSSVSWPDLDNSLMVIRLDWLEECRKQKKVVPFGPYLVYSARVVPKPPDETSPQPLKDGLVTYIKATPESPTDVNGRPTPSASLASASRRPLNTAQASAPHSHYRRTSPIMNKQHPPPPRLHRTTTSEHESLTKPESILPNPPQWVKDHNVYACQRDTPLHPANATFIEQLTKIKNARLLTLDEIGVRAYSTSIASIAAYPYLIRHTSEITRLPGCNEKIAALWKEWVVSSPDDESTRKIQAVEDLNHDEDLKHLRYFWEIWGVGPDTARKFYFEYGWKDIDDIVEFGWNNLNRVQQIGVKYYDELQVRIPRKEVEEIAAIVHRHARLCKGIPEELWGTDADIEMVIVGGYRRGKEESGDVDLILSHRDDAYTKDLVVDVVRSLETEGFITHTLSLQTTTSNRDQQTLPYRSKHGGHGFDSLDKALCVWQDPEFDDQGGEVAKNPNIHRRVDIIISPWRTVGCAVLGWSGGTTFQRDIRRYATKERGWKFDSSGLRNRGNGLVVDLESPKREGDGDSWLDREKRLMDSLGIGWRDPTLRCTG